MGNWTENNWRRGVRAQAKIISDNWTAPSPHHSQQPPLVLGTPFLKWLRNSWNNQLHILGTTEWLGPFTKYLQWCQYQGFKRLSNNTIIIITTDIYTKYFTCIISFSPHKINMRLSSFIFQMRELRFRKSFVPSIRLYNWDAMEMGKLMIIIIKLHYS